MPDVFISYSREDRARAEQVARGLKLLGLDPFWDTDIPPGQTWADYIEAKLAQCKAVVVLWSEYSTKSQWVREEARMGRDRAQLIPARLDNATPPFGFGEVQAANLSDWHGDASHADWKRFSHAVYAAVRGADTPIPEVQQPQWTAPQPQQQFTPTNWSTSPGASASPAAPTNESPLGYVMKSLRLYVNGKGRARRAEYWWWIAFTVALSFAAAILDVVLFGYNSYTNQANVQVISLIAGLAVLAPTLSVMSRRFHDVGVSGWLVAPVFAGYFVGGVVAAVQPALGGLLVIVIGIAVLVVTVLPSKPGANQYGPNPKGE